MGQRTDKLIQWAHRLWDKRFFLTTHKGMLTETAHAWVGGGWPTGRHIRLPGSQGPLSDTHASAYSALTPNLCTSLWLTALLHVHPHCLLEPLSAFLSTWERLSSPVIPVKRGTSHQCKKGSQLLTGSDEQRGSLQAGLGLFEGQVLDCSLPGLPSACLWFSCLRPSQDWDLETWLVCLWLWTLGLLCEQGLCEPHLAPSSRTGSLFKPQGWVERGNSCTNMRWFSLQCLAQQALKGPLLTSSCSPPPRCTKGSSSLEEFMGRLLTLFHWRVGFSSSQPPVLGKHLILGPFAYILVVLGGTNRNKTQLLPFNSLQLAAQHTEGARASQPGRAVGDPRSPAPWVCSLHTRDFPHPLAKFSCTSCRTDNNPTSGLCRDGVRKHAWGTGAGLAGILDQLLTAFHSIKALKRMSNPLKLLKVLAKTK